MVLSIKHQGGVAQASLYGMRMEMWRVQEEA
ncbi:hypothetical protein HU200_044630 [Digitaria exilis]|uniref:Uncharacterized protein n=1 Tax=Digitaria exilis TaxID=1010633 RepID=A0A835B156_9POAL|nr:hypothetical protein HU200_044630 [Digitaria exilis]